jgi:hypothetical protein
MQQDTDAMKNYFTKEAWARWKDHYEEWPSPDTWLRVTDFIESASRSLQ